MGFPSVGASIAQRVRSGCEPAHTALRVWVVGNARTIIAPTNANAASVKNAASVEFAAVRIRPGVRLFFRQVV